MAFVAPMAPAMAPTRAMPIMQSKEELATALNPTIGYCARSLHYDRMDLRAGSMRSS